MRSDTIRPEEDQVQQQQLRGPHGSSGEMIGGV
jgi:hypothetical protein